MKSRHIRTFVVHVPEELLCLRPYDERFAEAFLADLLEMYHDKRITVEEIKDGSRQR